jgi:hypothetical protein
MAQLTVEQDMKLGVALDQLEDAIEAAYASLKMVEWAQLNVARYLGGVVAPKLNAEIRSVPFEIEKLWELAQTQRKIASEETDALSEFIERHNHKILNIVIQHED